MNLNSNSRVDDFMQSDLIPTDGYEKSSSNIRNSHERPAFKLSVRLIDTYKYINKVISLKARKDTMSQSYLNRKGLLRSKSKAITR
jgi:hypothetical protein